MTFLRGVLAPPGQVGESSFTRKSWPSAHPARRDTRLSKALTFSRRFKRSRTCLLTQQNRRQPPRMPFQELSSLKSIITLDQLISSNRIKKLSPWPITKSKCRESFQPSLSNFAQLSKKEKNWLQGSRWLRVCNKTVQACKRTPYWKSKSTDSRLARGLTRRVISLLYTFLARVAVQVQMTAAVKTRLTLTTLCVFWKIKGKTTSRMSSRTTTMKTLAIQVHAQNQQIASLISRTRTTLMFNRFTRMISDQVYQLIVC